MDQIKIGKFISELRKSKNMTQQQDKKGTYVFGSVFPSKKTQEEVMEYLRKQETVKTKKEVAIATSFL